MRALVGTTGRMFSVGDRVRFGPANAHGGLDGLRGTVVGFVTPEYAAALDAPDDVVVRWDSGLQLAHAPTMLAHAESTS
jgi:hypothetical protein